MSLALASRRAALLAPWNKNELWRRAKAVPSLDLRFADNKSLVDATSGQNLVTFTRASGATYVDSQGVIRPAVTNLLLRSEEFDNASWTSTNVVVTGNAAVSPTGSLTAGLLAENTANSVHAIAQSTVTSGVAYVVSVYVKAAGRSRLQITGLGAEAQGYFTDYNLDALTVSSAPPGSSITPVGDGWYRCVMPITASSTNGVTFRLRNASGNASYQGDGTSGIYIWGAQLEQSTTVGEYVPTGATINSAPRFDHNPVTGESLGLLVEEQRTNLNTNSEALDTYGVSSGSVIANQGAAPDGASTADEITSTGGGAFKSISGTAASTVYTVSVFAKYISGGGLFNFGFDANPSSGRADFNLQTGALGAVVGANVISRSITPYGNGWYRCSVTATVTSTSTIIVFYSTTSGAKWLCWGAQLEAGAFPTSYIKTEASAVTRAADVASISGSNFSSWYRQDEGTVFAEYRLPAAGIGIATIDDGTANNIIPIFTGAAVLQAASANAIVAGANSGRLDSGGSFVANSLNRAAYAIKIADRALSANGATATASATPSAMPVVTQLQIQGQSTFAALKGGTIKRLTFWPQRLPNSTLQAITQ